VQVIIGKEEIVEACVEWVQKHHGLTVTKFTLRTNIFGGGHETLSSFEAIATVVPRDHDVDQGPYRSPG